MENSLAKMGKHNVELAEERMGGLVYLRKRLSKQKPFRGLKISVALHVTKETAVLVRTLKEAGADIYLASCNPLSTQDDVANFLKKNGIHVYAKKGETIEEYWKYIEKIAKVKPHLIIDDGGDLTVFLHEHPSYMENIIGGCEETTTGVIRIKNMERAKKLRFPVVAVNNNKTKHLLDNYYGTGQSTWDGILRAINPLIAGKTVVVCGYGSCGKGVALRAKGLGAKVIVTEVNPFRALQAYYDGYEVMPIKKAAKLGDIFITVTGNKNVIDLNHIKLMKPGVILANAGHFDVEINVKALRKHAKRITKIRNFVEKIDIFGKHIYLLSDGRLVNLSAAEGHPSEVMDTSFCGQVLGLEWLIKNKNKLKNKVYELPENLDMEIARLRLRAMGITIDKLTKEQIKYLNSWKL